MDANSQLEVTAQHSGGFDGLVGLELTELSAERARGRVLVRDQLRQPDGAVHGGLYASIADSLASLGTAAGVAPERKRAAAISTHTNSLIPITSGAIHAAATPKHRGRTTWVWEVEISDDDGRLCVVARVTVGVREG